MGPRSRVVGRVVAMVVWKGERGQGCVLGLMVVAWAVRMEGWEVSRGRRASMSTWGRWLGEDTHKQ